MVSETAEDEGKVSSSGLHVVYGSRTRRGLAHANEDRHAVAYWSGWKNDAHLYPEAVNGETREPQSYPIPHVIAPSCTGSARKDTTFCGVGSTGNAVNPLELNGGMLDSSNTPDTKTNNAANSRDRTFLWTVCDGHDGPEAADFVCKNVGDCFSRIWHSPGSHKLPPNMTKDKKNLTEENKMYMRGYALSNSLARTFEALDNSFKANVTSGDEGQSRSTTCTAGSCVTSIFLTDNLMCCAGLGDCKAAILTLEEADMTPGPSKSGDQSTTTEEKQTSSSSKPTQQFQVTWFSKEHRLSAPKERARIRARGGWFRHGRVGGVLEPTRTIGDFDIKASQPSGVVIATPEVRTFSVSKPALVCIASDGIWDFIDASQLLRTFKRRRRLWRGILSWLDACVQPKRGLMGFGFRRRAKSKEGLNLMTHMPTGGDLCALADTLVTRAHDLGSDDDCTCIVLYLRPAVQVSPSVGVGDGSSKKASDAGTEEQDLGEPDQDIMSQRRTNCTPSNAPVQADDDDDDEEEEEELEEEDDYENQDEPEYDAGADSSFEYEKWRNPMDPAEGDGAAEDVDDDWSAPPDIPVNGEQEEQEASQRPESKFGDVWDLSTATFPVTCQGMETLFPSNAVDMQDAPEVIEKARKRREERRAARERRKKSLEEEQLRRTASVRSEHSLLPEDTKKSVDGS